MARVELCRALEEAVRYVANVGGVELNESQRKALDILAGAIKGEMEVPLGAVQGPPGTGKTSIVEAFARYVLPKSLDDIESRELVVYVAPTNYLAVEAFKRIAAALLSSGGFTLRDVLDMTRVYGHKVVPGSCADLRNKGITEDMVRRVIHGEVRPGAVRLVFATEFQRVSGRFAEEPGRVHLIVDEASKSPYFRAFIPMADAVMRFKGYLSSLVALGDPEQAIAVPREFRGTVPLLMEKIMGLLRRHGLEEDNYELLRVTYRLPKPSEEPISHGFYDGKLQAHYTASRRLAEVRYAFEDSREKVLGLLDEIGASDTETMMVHEAIYNAVTSDVPLVVLDTGREFRPASKAISTYDGERARVAVKAALVLQAYSLLGGGPPAFGTLVNAPYSDMASNVSFAFATRYTSRLPRLRPPSSLTVHSHIGGESDFVVAVLGKEYMPSSSKRPAWAPDPLLTIYFNEPQVLNVQLSRHKKLLVIVGHVGRLAVPRRHPQWRKLADTASSILDLADRGHALHVKLS